MAEFEKRLPTTDAWLKVQKFIVIPLAHCYPTLKLQTQVHQCKKTSKVKKDNFPPSKDSANDIQKLLNFKDNDICYVISNYGDYDDKLLPFKEVFNEVYSRGFGTILLNKTADTLFLDTEQERGPADRFIGKRIN